MTDPNEVLGGTIPAGHELPRRRIREFRGIIVDGNRDILAVDPGASRNFRPAHEVNQI
jgi:hypothetical protein